MLDAARAWPEGRFVVAGPQYPKTIEWPANVERIEHLSPREHAAFYNAQRFTLNVTRADMVRAGWSPSVRLFEAAACGVAIVSDVWPGIDSIFRPGAEILLARDTADAIRLLRKLPEAEREMVGRRARERVLREHTAAHRALEIEEHVEGIRSAVGLRKSG
jgi:spore maturation protein CgeB